MKKTPQQHPALPTARPQADTEPLKTKSEEEPVLLKKIITEAKAFRRPSPKAEEAWAVRVLQALYDSA